jgi:hypothetical protein
MTIRNTMTGPVKASEIISAELIRLEETFFQSERLTMPQALADAGKVYYVADRLHGVFESVAQKCERVNMNLYISRGYARPVTGTKDGKPERFIAMKDASDQVWLIYLEINQQMRMKIPGFPGRMLDAITMVGAIDRGNEYRDIVRNLTD